jgi:ParB family chromosome partitioning protein
MTDRKPDRRGLGRGLSALMADVGATADVTTVAMPGAVADRRAPIELVHANPTQPRRDFAPAALAELTESIRRKGVIQPLIVRPHPSIPGHFEIVAGERRWRAAQAARQHDVPILVRDLNDAETLEIAIIENIQRSDLNPIEEAMGYRQLIDRFGHTQDQLAEALSKSRSYIANLVRLLQLPEEVQSWLRDGKLTAGHARALITSPDPVALARQVIDKALSVRETERLARAALRDAEDRRGTGPDPGPDAGRWGPYDTGEAETRELQADISAALKMKVVIDHRGHDGGNLIITYRSLDQLDQLCQILGRGL